MVLRKPILRLWALCFQITKLKTGAVPECTWLGWQGHKSNKRMLETMSCMAIGKCGGYWGTCKPEHYKGLKLNVLPYWSKQRNVRSCFHSQLACKWPINNILCSVDFIFKSWKGLLKYKNYLNCNKSGLLLPGQVLYLLIHRFICCCTLNIATP